MASPPVPADQLWRGFGVPAAAGDAWLEALVPLQYAAYPLRDASGRPLGELNAPSAVREGVPFDVRPCPYPDARRGRPMNAGALRPVRDHLPWVLDAIGALRSAYAVCHPETREGLDPAHAFGFSAVATCLPMFLVRTGAAADGSVPVEVGALFKVVQGVYMSAWADWAVPEQAPPPGVPLAADPWVDRMLARDRLFHRVTGRVCSGPEPLIREIVAACVGPSPRIDDVSDAARLLAYGQAWAALALEIWLLEPRAPWSVPRVRAHRDLWMGAPAGSEPAEERITRLQHRVREATGAPPPSGTFDRRWLRQPRRP